MIGKSYFVAEMNDSRIFTIFDVEEYTKILATMTDPTHYLKTMIENSKFIKACDDLGNPVMLNTNYIVAFRVMTQKF